MKLLKWLLLSVLLHISLFAQTTREKEIARVKNNPEVKLNYIGNDKVSVNYNNKKTRIFNLGSSVKQKPQYDSIPHLVFDLWNMDTSLFNYKFKFDQEVPLANYSYPVLLGDINQNGKVEMYGIKKGYYTGFSEVYCYEQNPKGIFSQVYKYAPNSLLSYNIYDIDRDGNQELHLILTHLDSISHYTVHDQTFYKKFSDDSLATRFYFNYNIYQGGGDYIQLNDFTFGDFDKDGITEAIYYNFGPQSIRVVKFNKSLLTFDSLLAYPTIDKEDVAGFTIGDFDMDGKTDIIYSSAYGNIYVLENEGIDKYSINWQGNSGVYNSYINFKTNDIDGNGKPEYWIGGEDFVANLTHLVCFETDGDNSYHEVAEIDFPGLLSLFGISGKSIDVDNDGQDEIIIHNGNAIVILKFTGTPNHPDYQIYYFRNFDIQVENATIYQFPNEKYPSIVLSMTEYNNQHSRLFSWILKHYLRSGVQDEKPDLPDRYELYNNFPNPFNPSTKISFSIPERSRIKIRVFNSLGEEIITLLNNTLEKGEHSIAWNGTGKNNKTVPSGIYLITMEAKSFRKTIKSVFLK